MGHHVRLGTRFGTFVRAMETYLSQAIENLPSDKVTEETFADEIKRILLDWPKSASSNGPFAPHKAGISEDGVKMAFSFRAKNTEFEIDLNLAKVIKRLSYIAFGSASGGGTVYLFGPQNEEQTQARERKAIRISETEGSGPRGVIPEDRVWAEHYMQEIIG